MIDAIKHFFTEKITANPNEQVNIDRRVAIAVCALLLEMAHADEQFNKQDEENILSILKQKHHLSDEDAHKLLDLAELEREESLDLWQFTNLINQNFSKFEKRGVIETLWQVIYADGKADKHEEYLMRRLVYLLNIPHEEMITAKLQARERGDRHVSDDNP